MGKPRSACFCRGIKLLGTPSVNLNREKLMTFKKTINRRQLLKTSAAAGTVLAAPSILWAAEPAKPAELIVRAWGGPWVEALKNGVSDPSRFDRR